MSWSGDWYETSATKAKMIEKFEDIRNVIESKGKGLAIGCLPVMLEADTQDAFWHSVPKLRCFCSVLDQHDFRLLELRDEVTRIGEQLL